MTTIVAINGGESETSKTRALIAPVVEERGGRMIDLYALPADGLLGRVDDQQVDEAVTAATEADVLIVATPIYRATYTGTVKAFFDRFQTRALASTVVVLVATASVKEHFLSIDNGARSLIASLEGLTIPKVVYATSDDFTNGAPSEACLDALRDAVGQAQRLSSGL